MLDLSITELAAIAPLQRLDEPVAARAGVRLSVLRLDRVDTRAPGNKYFKLLPNLRAAQSAGYHRLASFGGAYSNHIHALAALGRDMGVETLGYIRAPAGPVLTPTLRDAESWGMRLHYLTAAQYRRRADPDFLAQLQAEHDAAYWIPEGGSNRLGAEGCRQIVQMLCHQLGDDFSDVVTACGSGGTLAGVAAGLATGLPAGKRALGIAVLKGEAFLERDVAGLLAEMGVAPVSWRIEHRFHGGGYARVSPELVSWVSEFSRRHKLPLEPVYTGKLFYGLLQLLEEGAFVPGSHVVALHTGGLQGARGGDIWSGVGSLMSDA